CEEKNIKIADVLGANFSRKVALALKKLNIVYIDQLINKAGGKMITWQQLKILRGSTSRGRQAKWFTKIKKNLLVDRETRTIRETARIGNPEKRRENQGATIKRIVAKTKKK
ncbi:10189_t:CDS:2, partial [Gigaspora rosea]